MKILVAYASRMGSNAEIAQRIGQQLREVGHDVDVSACDEAGAVADYEAVIIGSALYVGRWEKAAITFLKSQAPQLAERPTWSFQSGPCGAGFDLERTGTPRAVRRVSSRIGLAPPVTFGGRLDRAVATTRVSRWMATGTFAGDFRDWEQVRAWTAGIATQLSEGRLPTA